MVLSGTTDEKIASIAAAQRGRVARRQLLMAGLSPKMIKIRISRGLLHPRHAGVYAVRHVAAVDLGDEAAALLAAPPGAVLSHDTAAVHWSLRRPAAAVPIHITVPACSCPKRPGICAHRTRTLLPRDVRVRDGLPVTSPARSLLDIAGRIPPRELELALDEGLRRGILRLGQVHDVLERGSNRAGAHSLRALVSTDRTTTVTRSEAEERFLALVREATLPIPEVNAPIHGFIVDFLWRRERIVVEVDGYAFHGSRCRFEDDRARDAKLVAAGFHVIRVTWLQMDREAYAVIARLAQALAWADARPP